MQTCQGQQTLSADDLFRARMHHRYAHPRGDGRKDDDEHGENNEQCSWVREDVPGSLNGSEKTVHERVFGDDFDFFARCSFHGNFCTRISVFILQATSLMSASTVSKLAQPFKTRYFTNPCHYVEV